MVGEDLEIDNPERSQTAGPVAGTVQPMLGLMIVDDNAAMRTVLRAVAQMLGDFDVRGEADDGRSAVELAARIAVDVIVLDVDMPVLDGLSALPRIKQAHPDATVVMYSSTVNALEKAQAILLGAAAVFDKSHHTAEDVLVGARQLHQSG